MGSEMCIRDRCVCVCVLCAAGGQVRRDGKNGVRHLEPADLGGTWDSWSHHVDVNAHSHRRFVSFPSSLVFFLFMACAHVAFCDDIEPHTDGDPSVLVEGGQCEISCEAPVHILQEPRREYHC